MKKALFILTIMVMAFGNMGFAQSKAELRAKTTERIFKLFGLGRESYIVPQQANSFDVDGTQHRTTYYYDESEYTLTEEIAEIYYDAWTNESRVTYDYGFYGNVIEMLGQTWDGNAWEDVVRASFDYDGDVVKEVVYQFNMGGVWVNDIKEEYSYDGDQWTVLFWAWNGTTWNSDELYTYTRHESVIELVIQYMEGGAWQNESKVIYTYDFDDNLEEILYMDWNSEGTVWQNMEKETYVYEGSVYTDQYVQSWDGAGWNDEYHYVYEYDGNGNAKHGACFEYEGGTWIPGDGEINMAYGYNADTKSFYASEVEMDYVDLTAVNENAQANNVKVYPVPAENELFIQADGFQKAEVYNVTGQKLMESNVDVLNVSTLSAGVYLLKVYDIVGNCATQRVVVK